MVTHSSEYGCWIYRCQWGCFGADFESTQEAEEALVWHDCTFGKDR